MNFGERLRRERLAAGLSQRELARTAGVRQSTVCGIEQGRRGLTVDMARRLADALTVDIADIMLEGPGLFEVEFAVGEFDVRAPPPWMERSVLSSVPEAVRGRVSVWPFRADGVLRLRARASALPTLASLAGHHVDKISCSLPSPTVRPVSGSGHLTVLIRASTKTAARADIDGRVRAAECSPRVTINNRAGLWEAHLTRVSQRASFALQGLTPTSPIGLFVPA